MRFLLLFSLILICAAGCGKTVREARLHEASPQVKLSPTASPLI